MDVNRRMKSDVWLAASRCAGWTGPRKACHYDWLKARLFVVLCLKFTALWRCSSLCFEVIDDCCEILYLSSLLLACHRPRKPPFPWIPLQKSARHTWLVVACGGWVVLNSHLAVVHCLCLRTVDAEFSSRSPRAFIAVCHIQSNLRIWYRDGPMHARSPSVTKMQNKC